MKKEDVLELLKYMLEFWIFYGSVVIMSLIVFHNLVDRLGYNEFPLSEILYFILLTLYIITHSGRYNEQMG